MSCSRRGPRARSSDRGRRGDVSFVERAEEFAERVVVAVDVRGGHLMIDGWREEGPELEAALRGLDDAGTPPLLVTAIAGTGRSRARPHALPAGAEAHGSSGIASGGVRNAEDVWALRDVGCEAAVTGKALYEKTLKLSQVTRGAEVMLAKRDPLPRRRRRPRREGRALPAAARRWRPRRARGALRPGGRGRSFLDIAATLEERKATLDVVPTAEEVFIPLTVGGVKGEDDVEALLRAGATRSA